MKSKHIQNILLLFVCSIIILTTTACVNEIDPPTYDTNSTNDTINSETEQQSSDSTTEQVDEVNAILADLNHDGTDDKIVITYDDEQKSSATIQVMNGIDNSELMSDTLMLGGERIGAYYLQSGKGTEPDRLVFWCYGYLPNDRLAFKYNIFSFEPDGKINYGDQGEKVFDVSKDGKLASGQQVFLTMIKTINDNIQSVHMYYNGYLLLDNQGDSMLISTADNMLTPTELTFELEDFVIESEGE